MVISGVTMRRGPLARRLLIVAIVLALAAGCGVALLTIRGRLPGIAAGLGISGERPTAYTFIDGHIVRIDPTTGAVLARSSDFSMDQFPSIAVSHDGKSVFLLHTQVEDGYNSDQLVILAATTLAQERVVPLQHFVRSMDAWPPALAVTPDDRTVIIAQYGLTDSDPYWLSYYDRQAGRLSWDTTILWNCGVSQLLPVQELLAVLCMQTDDLRIVDLRSHQVTGQIEPWAGGLGNPVEAGVIPGQAAVAVILNHGNLVRADLATHTVSLSASLVPPNSEFEPVAAAYSANGRVAVLLGANDNDNSGANVVPLLIVDATTGRVLDRLSVDTPVGALTMSPDGRRVYVVAASGSLQEIDLATHQVKPFGPDPARTWVHLVFADR